MTLGQLLMSCDANHPSSVPAAQVTRGATSAVQESSLPLVVFLGDSLTAGAGLAQDAAFPALIHAELERAGIPIRIVNAGVSGDTSAGGLRRLAWLLRQEPDVVVVALGANDGLRGLSSAQMEANLREIVASTRAAGARVLLVGMKVPPNYGAEYGQSFEQVFPALAEELELAYVPFLLEGVAGEPALNLPDGIHPNERGYERVAQNVLPKLRELLQQAK
jgi:acyl-CoA thioesterase-1